MPYAYPVGDIYVPADWWNHAYGRTPPSSEPGTDYACAYGSPVGAPESGTVIEVKTNNSGAMGRYVAIALDDGRSCRGIHLSAVYVQAGYRVARGAIIGASGASGNGSDWYYGPHLHQTLWPGAYWGNPTIDFEVYVGADPAPIPPQPEPTPPPLIPMEKEMLCVANKDDNGTVYTVGQRYLHHVSNGDEANVAANLYNNGVTWRKDSKTLRIMLEQKFIELLCVANGVPKSALKDTKGGKTWVDGKIQ